MKFVFPRKNIALYAASLVLSAASGIFYSGFITQIPSSAFTAAQLAAANIYGVSLVGTLLAISSFSAMQLAIAAISGVAIVGTVFGVFKMAQFGLKRLFARFYKTASNPTSLDFKQKKSVPEKHKAPKILSQDELNRQLADVLNSYPCSSSEIERLISAGASVKITNRQGETPLIKAAENGSVNLVKMLIPYLDPDDLSAMNTYGTALMAAARNGQTAIVRTLLNVPGIEVNHGDTTALMWAARYCHIDVVTALLAFPGIQINKQREDGATALMIAAENGHTAIITTLLAAPGIQFNLQRQDGETALMRSAQNNHLAIVRALIATSGIQENLLNQERKNAIVLAAENGHTAVVSTLIEMPPKTENIHVQQILNLYTITPALVFSWENGHRETSFRLLSALKFEQVGTYNHCVPDFSVQCQKEVLNNQKHILNVFGIFRNKPALADNHGPIRNVLSFIHEDWYRHRANGDENLMAKKLTHILEKREKLDTSKRAKIG
jgi:ankyrin repeat protein